MEKTEKMFKLIRHSINSRPWGHFKNCGGIVTTRNYCKESKEVANSEKKSLQKPTPGENLPFKMLLPSNVQMKFWNEEVTIKRARKKKKFYRSENLVDFLEGLQKMRNFPGNLTQLVNLLKQREARNQLIEQKYLPERHAILGPDLATAHFLLRRRGAVKFLGQNDWMGGDNSYSLAVCYIPGLHVQCINAENSNLYFEGLKNLCDLKYLDWLSLKGLVQVNDWWLDWISNEYYKTLSYLDISGCKNVTHRGLSCFYRFENLKTLKVEGVSDSPDFKLALLMLQDIFPDLEILGIELTPPESIDPLDSEAKRLPDNQTSLTQQ